MINRMAKLNEYIDCIDFSKLWPEFTKTNFAIYNEEYVYFNDDFQIDIDLKKVDSIFVGKVDNRFSGNTAISINNRLVAIWDESFILKDMDNKRLASLIIHEMFHCFQFKSYDKSRFPNELLGMDYPITIENINLRTLERQYILEWFIEENKEKKLELLNDYFNVREEREKLIGSIINYEKALESFEGTAFYVEFKSLNQLNPNAKKLIIEEMFDGFSDISEENLKIRESSYKQGALLSLIGDEYLPNWKERFKNSNSYLSEFIKENIKYEKKNFENTNKNLDKIEKIIHNREEKINKLFDEFNNKDKENILKEDIEITRFDPMNMIKRNNEIIHNRIITIKTGEKEESIKGPVKVTIGNGFFDIKKVEW